jgi:PAS domain S-box-containing protein
MGLDERAIFLMGPVVVFQWRNEPGWPVEYASANASEVFGYTAEELVRGDVSYGSLIVGDDGDRVTAEVGAAVASGAATFVHRPYRVRHRDGSVRWLYDSARVVRGDDGQVQCFLGYVIDITAHVRAEEEKRELERRLLHAQKLESLGVLAGGVAHDFNNLLAGILGQASLARRELGSTSGHLAESIDQIERLALRAADLTRQLLAYSGKGRFVVEPVDVGELVRDMASMLEVVISKKAALRLLLAPELPAVMADRTQLQQVIMNLITNASEALGEEAGSITIRTAVETCTSAYLEEAFGVKGLASGPYVSLEVSDTGVGMTPEVLGKLFDPFFTTKAAGRGLGMSAVLGIVRGHGGAIRVYSELGKGTSFRLLFPASDLPAVRAPRRAPADGWRGEGTVLVVDDEDEVRSVTATICERLGFRTARASHGGEALELFAQHRDAIVLVILDMTMPVMGGEETLRALRREAPDLPIVMTSGFNEQDAINRLAGRKLTGFLQKPFRVEDVEAALRTALEERMSSR